MVKIEGMRARVRAEVTAAIKEEARRQLARHGAGQLSLRAVARELGMASSALYRYFPSRDELLTALIVDAYDAIGGAAEAALVGSASVQPLERWRAVCRAVRGWALAHPHEYALIYGSPVPGYAAPSRTADAAGRVGLALIEVLREACERGGVAEPEPAPPRGLLQDAERLRARLEIQLPVPVLARALVVWPQLFGLVSFELFGQFHRVIEERTAYFDHAVDQLAESVGLLRGPAPLCVDARGSRSACGSC